MQDRVRLHKKAKGSTGVERVKRTDYLKDSVVTFEEDVDEDGDVERIAERNDKRRVGAIRSCDVDRILRLRKKTDSVHHKLDLTQLKHTQHVTDRIYDVITICAYLQNN